MPDTTQQTLDAFGYQLGTDTVPTPNWSPNTDPSYNCSKCGTRVSPSFFRVWAIDGELNGCPECVPRSVRFGEDVYGRERDDFEPDDFDKHRHNEGRDPGGVKRKGTAKEFE